MPLPGIYAFVTGQEAGFRIVDVTNPQNPVELGYLDTAGSAQAVHVVDDVAYLAAGPGGLRVIDVSDLSAPVEVAAPAPPAPSPYARDVFVLGHFAYVAHGYDRSHYMGLEIYDISSPTQPTRVGTYTDGAGYARVRVSGHLAYLRGGATDLTIVDVSDPPHPTRVGALDAPLPDYGNWFGEPGLALVGNYVYLTSGAMFVIDVSDPTHPRRIGEVSSWPYDVRVAGQRAYLLHNSGTTLVFDVSNAGSPRQIASVNSSGYGIDASGSYAYLANGNLRVVNLSDLGHPQFGGSSARSGFTDWHVFVQDRGGAAPPTYTISGRILDEAQRGIASADVHLNGLQSRNITTSSDGAYAFGDLPPGDYTVWGEKPGYAASASLHVAVPPSVSNADIVLHPGYTISGRITDANGVPMGRVGYTCRSSTGTAKPGANLAEPLGGGGGGCGQTDDVGRYTTPYLPAGNWVITPEKQNYTFSPSSRTVHLPPEQTRQDFVGYVQDAVLADSVRQFAADNSRYLSQVKGEGESLARDGDYFGTQKTQDEVKLVADAVVDSVGVLSDGLDDVSNVKDMAKMNLPGVAGGGWGHIIRLQNNSQDAAKLFSTALQLPVTPQNAHIAAQAFLSGADTYFGAKLVDTGLESLSQEGLRRAWTLGLSGSDALQSKLVPPLRDAHEVARTDLGDTTTDLLSHLPSLPQDRRDAFTTDLHKRSQANVALAFALQRRAMPVHLARSDRESQHGDWVTDFLGKYVIKGAAFLYADGAGVMAVDAAEGLWHLYDNLERVRTDARMMALATQGGGGALDTLRKIHVNTIYGLEGISRNITPQIADAQVSSIVNKSIGEYKLFGKWWWWETESYSDVTLRNQTDYRTTYQVLGAYGRTGFLGTSFQPLLEEGVAAGAGRASNVARLHYNWGSQGVSPDENSTIEMDVLGTTDTGTYFITHTGTQWTRTHTLKNGDEAPIPVGLKQANDAPTLPYPIRSRVETRPDSLTYVPHLWIDNPFTQTIQIRVMQPLPEAVQVIAANGAMLNSQNLVWMRSLEPQSTVEITHVIRYDGATALPFSYPSAQLDMSDPAAGSSATFTGPSVSVRVVPPVAGVGDPPHELELGTTVRVPVTLINRANVTVDATLRFTLTDMDGRVLDSPSHSLSLSPFGETSVGLLLRAPTVAGVYILEASVESSGGSSPIFATYVEAVPRFYRVYLPALLNGTSLADDARQPTSTPAPALTSTPSATPVSPATSVPSPTPSRTPTATPTPTATGTPTPRPTNLATTTFTPTPGMTTIPAGRIEGQLLAAGAPAPGQTLALRRYNSTTTETVLTTTTTSAGYYQFANPPALAQGDKYYVYFGPNTSHPEYVHNWLGPDIVSYATGQTASGGVLNIADAPLVGPPDGGTVAFPATLTWRRRSTPTDSYRVILYDLAAQSVLWTSDPLGYRDSLTIASSADVPHLEPGKPYYWWLEITDSATNGNSFGAGYAARRVTFGSAPTPTIPPPSNDTCSGAVSIPSWASWPQVYRQDTRGATAPGSDPTSCGGEHDSHSVWYRWVAPSDGTLAAATCGSNFDTVLTIWEGAACDVFGSPLGCSDDSCSVQSQLTVGVHAGTAYLIKVASYGDDDGGDLQLRVEFTVPATATPTPSPTPTPTATRQTMTMEGVLTDIRIPWSESCRDDFIVKTCDGQETTPGFRTAIDDSLLHQFDGRPVRVHGYLENQACFRPDQSNVVFVATSVEELTDRCQSPFMLSVDDKEWGFEKFGAEQYWRNSASNDVTYAAHAYWTGTKPTSPYENYATWTPQLWLDGWYEVWVYIPLLFNSRDDTRGARYEIKTAADSWRTALVDQAAYNLSHDRNVTDRWFRVGAYWLEGNQPGVGQVKLGDYTGESGRGIGVDAVKWVYRGRDQNPR